MPGPAMLLTQLLFSMQGGSEEFEGRGHLCELVVKKVYEDVGDLLPVRRARDEACLLRRHRPLTAHDVPTGRSPARARMPTLGGLRRKEAKTTDGPAGDSKSFIIGPFFLCFYFYS